MSTTETRPIIGVTGPNRGGGPAWIFTWFALWRAGARARRITPAHAVDPSLLDGLVIGGGADVTEPLPAEADVVPPPPPTKHVRWPRRVIDLLFAPLVLLVRWLGAVKRHGADKGRDALEHSLLQYAKKEGLPVLGICRGAQLMNVVEGGTLLRNINTMYTERAQLYTVLPRREVMIEPGSRLREWLGRGNLLVNSLHFDAVDKPGPDFRVVAREPSGVIQAIERKAPPFWLGVQWHPEYLPQQEAHQQIFVALADAARAHRERRLSHPRDESAQSRSAQPTA